MRRDLAELAEEVRRLQGVIADGERTVFRASLEMGLLLVTAKQSVPRGSWIDWLNANGINRRRASRVAKVAHAARSRYPGLDDRELVERFGSDFPSVRAFEAAVRRRGGDASIAFREEARARAGREIESAKLGGRDGDESREPQRAGSDTEDQGSEPDSDRPADERRLRRSPEALRPAAKRRPGSGEEPARQLTFFEAWREIEARATRSVREIRSLADDLRRFNARAADRFSSIADELVACMDETEKQADGVSMAGAT